MNPITFSTLACPHWSIETIIAKASELGYDGIEWRGGRQGHVQPTMPSSQKRLLRQSLKGAGLIALAVTAYTSFVSDSSEERQSNVNELKDYADLAAELGASYVRTFLGELPQGKKPDPALYKKISDGLTIASEYAHSIGVSIAIEPHDEFSRSSLVTPLFEQFQPRTVLSVIWDIGNAFAVGEDPSEGFDLLQNHIAYVQVKDGKERETNWQLCSLGKGDIPLRRAFDLLITNHYKGAFSVEWEYAWHPELDPPEVALPDALRTVRTLLSSTQVESA